jgi:hypothetical protein
MTLSVYQRGCPDATVGEPDFSATTEGKASKASTAGVSAVAVGSAELN